MIILIIILALIAITGFIITTIMRKGLNPQDEYDRGQLKILSLIRTGIIIGCAAIFAIAMLIGGIKIMDQTEVGIVKTFGKVDHTISGGLNFVNPISDTVEVMDLRVHVNEASFASYTKDAQPLTAAIEYQYEPLLLRPCRSSLNMVPMRSWNRSSKPQLRNALRLYSPVTVP